MSTSTRYALIELNSGFVWWVGDADTPADACRRAYQETNGDERAFTRITESERYSSAGGFSVHEVPDGFDVHDGQDQEEIDLVEAAPFCGLYRAEG